MNRTIKARLAKLESKVQPNDHKVMCITLLPLDVQEELVTALQSGDDLVIREPGESLDDLQQRAHLLFPDHVRIWTPTAKPLDVTRLTDRALQKIIEAGDKVRGRHSRC